MARNVTLSRGSSYKNGGQQKTDTCLAFKLNEGVKLENVFDTLIGVNPSMEYIEHDGNGAIIGYSLKEAYYNETARAGIVLTSANKDTYFETNFRGNNSNTGGQFIPTNLKGQPNGVAELDATGKIPKSQMEFVEIDAVTGTSKIIDNNTTTSVVNNWSLLTETSTLVDGDTFYVTDQTITNGQNKFSTFGNIKEQLKTDVLKGVVIKDIISDKIPLTDLEIVQYLPANGTVETKDSNSSVLSVADASQLPTVTTMKDTDLFYINDPLIGTNEKLSLADLKKQILTECQKLPSQNLVANTTIKFPHTFATKDLASIMVYDSQGNVITNESNITTKVTATDIEVYSNVNIPNCYVICCKAIAGNVNTTTTPTTNVLSNTGYKIKSTVNNVVSNEIELPYPIVNSYKILDFINVAGSDNFGTTFKIDLGTLPIAPAGYKYKIDYSIWYYFQSFYDLEPQTILVQTTENKSIFNEPKNQQSITILTPRKYIYAMFNNIAGDIYDNNGTSYIELGFNIEKISNIGATFEVNNFNVTPKISYKIYLAKETI